MVALLKETPFERSGNGIEIMRIARVLEYGRQWKSTAKEVAGHSLLLAQFLSLLHLTDAYIFSPTLVRFLFYSILA